jgi:hypothetical protein
MRRGVRVLIFGGAAGAVVTAPLFVLLRFELFKHLCDQWDTVLARGSHGESVVYRLEACTILGTSVDESVDWVAPSGHRMRLFSFAPADSFADARGMPFPGLVPSATWLSPDVLQISLGTVAAIVYQRAEVDGIHVVYAIGRNLHLGERP